MSLQTTIEKIDALKAELDSLRPIQPEYEARLKQKFRLELTYNSNSIEGNSLSLGETKTFILHGITTGNKPYKDYQEIEGYNKALLEIEQTQDKNKLLTQADIRAFHSLILGGNPYYSKAITSDGTEVQKLITPGKYKTEPNHLITVTNEELLFTEPGLETEMAMTDLIEWCNKELAGRTLHPMEFASLLHYKFIRIHPFDDSVMEEWRVY